MPELWSPQGSRSSGRNRVKPGETGLSAATLGLAIIARDEEKTLPNLLASIEGAFDQVVLVDTGSTDRTVEVFRDWAEAADLPLGYRLETFEWVDDFAVARNAADALLETDWLCWADADEMIGGAAQLRTGVAATRPGVAGFTALCEYRRAPDGRPVSVFSPLRLVRRGAGLWLGRTQEGRFLLKGEVDRLPPSVVFVHAASDREVTESRVLRDFPILDTWLDELPDDPLALAIGAQFAHDLHLLEYMLSYLRLYQDALQEHGQHGGDSARWARAAVLSRRPMRSVLLAVAEGLPKGDRVWHRSASPPRLCESGPVVAARHALGVSPE
jgi:glycosyltransferase involved in cell wall biosynthesis